MLVIKTKLAPSPIHGIGVFSEQFVPAGGVVWTWHEGFDRKIPLSMLDTLPDVALEYMLKYGWEENGEYIICLDREQYINHSNTPNCIFTADGNTAIAACDIHVGDEITQDYKTFDANFGVEKHGYDWEVE